MVALQTSSKSPPKEETCENSDRIMTIYTQESPIAPTLEGSVRKDSFGGEAWYFLQAFFMVSSNGVKEKPGKALSSLSFSNHVWLTATLALSLVSRGVAPENMDFKFSIRQAIPSKKGVASLAGLFF